MGKSRSTSTGDVVATTGSNALSTIEEPSIATKYLDRIAKNRGFPSHREYIKFFRARIGATSESEYQQFLAEKKGLETPSQYQKHLNTVRAQNPEYRKLASLIRSQLAELKMTQSELARHSGTSPRLISAYVHGFSYPKPKKLKRILQALRVFHQDPLVGRSHQFGRNLRMQKPRHQKYAELSNSIKWFFNSYRKDARWLAQETGIPVKYILQYAKGLIYPNPDRLKRIIRACDSLDARKTEIRPK